MLKQHASNIKYLNVITDLVYTGIAFWVAFYLRHFTRLLWRYGGTYYPEDYPLGFFIILPIWGILSFYFHSKHYYRFTSLKTDIFLSLKVSSIGIVTVLLSQYFLKIEFFPRSFLLIFYITTFIFLSLGRTLQRKFIGFFQKKGFNIKTLLIVGLNDRSKRFIDTLNSHKEWGLIPVGVININGDFNIKKFQGLPVLGAYNSFRKVLHKHPVDDVVFAFSFSEYKKIELLMDICSEEGVHYLLVSNFFDREIGEIHSDKIFGIPILYFSPTPKHQFELKILSKRLIDIFASALLLILLSPLMLIISLLIYLTSGRPIFYRWNVTGFNKKPIKSWKFRTMINNADELKQELLDKNEMNGPVFKIADDPRVTPLGRFLRKYSIDELPQIWSVLKGDLSLVGPRPAGPYELERYEHWQRRKLSIKPGITCLWQVSGRNDINDFDEWVKLDLEYIDNWSLWLDLKILLKTIPAVIKGTGK